MRKEIPVSIGEVKQGDRARIVPPYRDEFLVVELANSVSNIRSAGQAEIDRLRAENAELRKACEQALSDFRFIEKTLPNSNFTSTTILLMEALKGGR